VHVRRLLDAELLVARRAPSGKGLVYELACSFDRDRSASGRPPVGLRSASGRPPVGGASASASAMIDGASDVFDGRPHSDLSERTSMGAARPTTGRARGRGRA
jgi:hypothetical protein